MLKDLRELIAEARQDVARQINSALVLLYWRIGQRICQDILKQKRAEYGEQIVSTLRRELSWTHFKQIIYLDDPLKRNFYAEMCHIEKWSTRTLEKKISGMLFERTALSKKLDELIRYELNKLHAEDILINWGRIFSYKTKSFVDFLSTRCKI